MLKSTSSLSGEFLIITSTLSSPLSTRSKKSKTCASLKLNLFFAMAYNRECFFIALNKRNSFRTLIELSTTELNVFLSEASTALCEKEEPSNNNFCMLETTDILSPKRQETAPSPTTSDAPAS